MIIILYHLYNLYLKRALSRVIIMVINYYTNHNIYMFESDYIVV